MGLLFTRVLDRLFSKQEMRILMVGLDAAGKTTVSSRSVIDYPAYFMLFVPLLLLLYFTFVNRIFFIPRVQPPHLKLQIFKILLSPSSLHSYPIYPALQILYKLKLGEVVTTIPTIGEFLLIL